MLHAEAAQVQEVVQKADILAAALEVVDNPGVKEQKPAMGGQIVQITSESYHKEVLESKLPVVLDAYMDHCHACHMMEPVLTELSNEMNGKVKFVKLNGQMDPLGRELKVKAFPTLIFFKNGKIVDRHVGAMDKNALAAKLNSEF